jgi:hypothetical protein
MKVESWQSQVRKMSSTELEFWHRMFERHGKQDVNKYRSEVVRKEMKGDSVLYSD